MKLEVLLKSMVLGKLIRGLMHVQIANLTRRVGQLEAESHESTTSTKESPSITSPSCNVDSSSRKDGQQRNEVRRKSIRESVQTATDELADAFVTKQELLQAMKKHDRDDEFYTEFSDSNRSHSLAIGQLEQNIKRLAIIYKSLINVTHQNSTGLQQLAARQDMLENAANQEFTAIRTYIVDNTSSVKSDVRLINHRIHGKFREDRDHFDLLETDIASLKSESRITNVLAGMPQQGSSFEGEDPSNIDALKSVLTHFAEHIDEAESELSAKLASLERSVQETQHALGKFDNDVCVEIGECFDEVEAEIEKDRQRFDALNQKFEMLACAYDDAADPDAAAEAREALAAAGYWDGELPTYGQRLMALEVEMARLRKLYEPLPGYEQHPDADADSDVHSDADSESVGSGRNAELQEGSC